MSRLRKLTELDLTGFDYSKIGPNALVSICGKRDSGKSTFARFKAQMSEHAKTGSIIAIIGSEGVKRNWAEVIHPMYIRDPSLELLRHIKKQQNDLIAKYIKKNKPFPKELHLTVILDDVGSLSWFMRSQELKELSSAGRWWECDVVMCLQYLKMIPPEVRENIDYIFLLSTGNTSTMKILVDEYVSCATVKLLSEIITAVTENFGVLAISNCKNNRTIQDTLFHTRVPTEYLENKTLLGGPQFLKYARKYYKNPNLQEVNIVNTEMESNSNEGDEEPNEISEHTFEDRYGRVIIRCLPKGELYKCKKD